MSLSASPTFTPGSAGNLYASTSLAASGTYTSGFFYVGVSGQSGAQGSTTTGSALSGRLQIWDVATTVAATNGLLVQIFSTSDGTNPDTIAYAGFTITSLASSTVIQSLDLPPGQYKVKLTNLDATNAIAVEMTLGTTA
jgi:hypothetical protein